MTTCETDNFIAVFKSLNVSVYPQARLAHYTTFQLGGPCPYLIHCRTPLQLEETISSLNHDGRKFILIGGGSNLVVSDQGVDCVVVRYVSRLPMIQRDGNDLIVTGSTNLDDCVTYAAHQGLAGLNYASGIPGTVGGAIVGNAGAFGKQVGDFLRSIILITQKGIKKDVPANQMGLRYRYSNLRETGDVVQLARFGLMPGKKELMLKERKAILKLRRKKHPNLSLFPSAGSFFRNVEPTSKAGRRQAAGWFLDQAGGKGMSVGGATIYRKHANIIVKTDGCTAQDVYDLSKKMWTLVHDHFGLDLTREIRFVGHFAQLQNENQKQLIW